MHLPSPAGCLIACASLITYSTLLPVDLSMLVIGYMLQTCM